jgi:hypothetical protein
MGLCRTVALIVLLLAAVVRGHKADSGGQGAANNIGGRGTTNSQSHIHLSSASPVGAIGKKA